MIRSRKVSRTKNVALVDCDLLQERKRKVDAHTPARSEMEESVLK